MRFWKKSNKGSPIVKLDNPTIEDLEDHNCFECVGVDTCPIVDETDRHTARAGRSTFCQAMIHFEHCSKDLDKMEVCKGMYWNKVMSREEKTIKFRLYCQPLEQIALLWDATIDPMRLMTDMLSRGKKTVKTFMDELMKFDKDSSSKKTN